MLTLRSILQQICQFFRGMTVKVTKRMYRSSAVFMAGAAVITVVAFTSAGFGSGGKNALTAFAETLAIEDPTDEEAVENEDMVTQANIQHDLTKATVQAQQLAGELLKKEIQKAKKQKLQKEYMQKAEETKEMVEEARQKAEEEKVRLEEEAKEVKAMSVSQEDYQVLLRIVQAEAGICDEKGKILVTNVILNRVKSNEFPNSVRGVVYERSQFAPVSNGSIHSAKVTDNTIQCVKRALAGEDYSDGALYFMYRGGSRRKAVTWFDSHLTYLFRYGKHEFFK